MPPSPDPDPPPATDPLPVLEYQAANTERRFTQVGTFHDPVEANLACLKLRSEGVECAVSGETSRVGLGGYGGPPAGGLSLQVAQDDAPRAQAILDEVEARRAAREAAEVRRCPACGSERTSQAPSTRPRTAVFFLVATGVLLCVPHLGAVALATAAVGVYLLVVPADPERRCEVCRHRWPDVEPEGPEEKVAGEEQG